MIVSAAYTLVRHGLQYRADNAAFNALILEKLLITQRNLERGKTLPRFIITEDATFTGLANVATAAIPASFIRWVEDAPPSYTTSTGKYRELEVGDLQQLRRLWTGSSETTPFAIARRKSTIQLFPTPTLAWTVTYSYYAKQTVLALDADENAWMLEVPDLMIAGAGFLLASDMGDQAGMEKFSGQWKTAYSAYFNQIIDDETADQTVILGGNN